MGQVEVTLLRRMSLVNWDIEVQCLLAWHIVSRDFVR